MFSGIGVGVSEVFCSFFVVDSPLFPLVVVGETSLEPHALAPAADDEFATPRLDGGWHPMSQLLLYSLDSLGCVV